MRVVASSVNAADLDYLYGRPAMTRMGIGLRRPRSQRLGLDVAGVVEAIGPGASRFSVGDEVFGDLTECGYGAFAEYAIATEEALAPKPSALSFEEAATVPQSAILAIQGLRAWKPVRAGDAVLVNGASGNVGPFAVQLAQAYGAEVTGVCSSAKVDFVRSLGVDDVIDYTRQDYGADGRRWDRILDVAAHRSVFAARRALRPGGVYAWAGGDMWSLLGALTIGPAAVAGDQPQVEPVLVEAVQAVGRGRALAAHRRGQAQAAYRPHLQPGAGARGAALSRGQARPGQARDHHRAVAVAVCRQPDNGVPSSDVDWCEPEQRADVDAGARVPAQDRGGTRVP